MLFIDESRSCLFDVVGPERFETSHVDATRAFGGGFRYSVGWNIEPLNRSSDSPTSRVQIKHPKIY